MTPWTLIRELQVENAKLRGQLDQAALSISGVLGKLPELKEHLRKARDLAVQVLELPCADGLHDLAIDVRDGATGMEESK